VAVSINHRGVNPIHSGIKSRVNRIDRILIVLCAPRERPIAAAHRPRADAQRCDEKIAVAELTSLHRCCPSRDLKMSDCLRMKARSLASPRGNIHVAVTRLTSAGAPRYHPCDSKNASQRNIREF
jgi:hypothetical protein